MANKSGVGNMDKGQQGAGASVEGTAAPAGRSQTPTPAGGAGAGKPVAREVPPWGNVVAEKAHCPPHCHPEPWGHYSAGMLPSWAYLHG